MRLVNVLIVIIWIRVLRVIILCYGFEALAEVVRIWNLGVLLPAITSSLLLLF